MNHKVNLIWKEGLHFEVHTPGGVIDIDGDPKFGGQGKGVRPKPLMLDALGGCMGMDVASLMTKMRADKGLENFHIRVEGALTEEHPKYYHEVWITVHFEGKELKKEKLKKIVQMSEERYCGVYAMFRHFAKMHLEVTFDEK